MPSSSFRKAAIAYAIVSADHAAGLAFLAPNKGEDATQSLLQMDSESTSQLQYNVGDEVMVWSQTMARESNGDGWTPGKVLVVNAEFGCVRVGYCNRPEGYGTTLYVDQTPNMIRHAAASAVVPVQYNVHDKVKVWSSSNNCWTSATVIETKTGVNKETNTTWYWVRAFYHGRPGGKQLFVDEKVIQRLNVPSASVNIAEGEYVRFYHKGMDKYFDNTQIVTIDDKMIWVRYPIETTSCRTRTKTTQKVKANIPLDGTWQLGPMTEEKDEFKNWIEAYLIKQIRDKSVLKK